MNEYEGRYELQIYRSEFDRMNGEVSDYEYCETIEESIYQSEEWISISSCVEVIDMGTNEVVLNFSREEINRVFYTDISMLETEIEDY